MVKRFFALALVLCLALSFASCNETQYDLVGTWALDMEGEPLSASYAYVFNEDGSGYYTLMGIPYDFTYDAHNGKITIAYEDYKAEAEYSISGSKLTISSDDVDLVLTRWGD